MRSRKPHPPRLADRFLQWFCSDEVLETLQGDLYELYDKGREKHGKLWADFYFIAGVLSACRSFAFRRRRQKRSNSNILGMYSNYFKIAWRSLYANKAYSALNISGLAIGLACSILIMLWVSNEVSYDTFHPNAKSIYRLTAGVGEGFKAAVSPAGMAAGLQAEMPEIISTVRLSKPVEALFQVDDRKFEETKVFYADSNFLEMFSFPLIEGNVKTALQLPEGILMTETTAKKYFGNENPIGKIIRKDNRENFTVNGILKNVPANSHLQFDMILPMASLAKTSNDLQNKVWGNFNFYSYLQLTASAVTSGQDRERLEARIDEIWKERGMTAPIQFQLQPLTDIHLYSDLQIDLAGHGNVQYVNILFVVALFILGVACINFMNLATARSSRRAREVGMRKVVGASRRQLIAQFLVESVTISFISLILSIGLVYLFLPTFNGLADKQLHFNPLEGQLLVGLIAVTLATGVISGSYPSLFLSGFKPATVLKGKLRAVKGNTIFRNSLVVLQLVISVALLVGAAVTHNQLSFIRNKNLGFDKSNLLYLSLKGDLGGKRELLEARLSANPQCSDFTIVSNLPMNLTTGSTDVDWEGRDPNSQIVIPDIRIDENFFDVFQVEVLKGRGFSDDISSDESNFIVNETAAKVMGFSLDDVLGQSVRLNDQWGKVVGVVKDFNFKPLQYAIEPLFLRSGGGGIAVVRIPAGKTEETIAALEAINGELSPAFPLAYNFVDQDLDNQYRGEQRISAIFKLFTLLAIFISSLGLYGLSAFIAEQHTKEIGIRKVLGATVAGLIRLLLRDFMKLVVVALFIAIPFSWYLMNEWLADFAYRVNIGWLVFVGAAVCAVAVTILTVSHQVIKVALMNPVKSLRSE
jgi:putative ABC transport system permease protein